MSSCVVSCRYVARRVGVGIGRVVGERPFAGAVRGEVLAPEQELDGVPTGGDVRLAALLVGLDDDVGGDLGVAGGVVDDAGRRVALDVVDVRLVHRPGVDLALGAVGGVVDRAVVEPERLGRAVVVAGGEPRVLGGAERRVGRVGDEGRRSRPASRWPMRSRPGSWRRPDRRTWWRRRASSSSVGPAAAAPAPVAPGAERGGIRRLVPTRGVRRRRIRRRRRRRTRRAPSRA